VAARDWREWHETYADPDSTMSRRLRRVQHRVREFLDSRPAGPIRVLSMCAGQGRDLLVPLADHPRRADVRAVLVELEPGNAAVARKDAQGCGSAVEVLMADAARTAVYREVVPVHLALVCGVFGNISDDDVRRTIECLPSLVGPGGVVIWTRHRREPDLTPAIRRWFAAARFAEIGFDTEPGYLFGVGTHRLAGAGRPFDPDVRLFTFEGNGAEATL
jgi:Putative methyltransferase